MLPPVFAALTSQSLLLVVLGCAAAGLIGYLLIRGDSRIEDFRRTAAEMAAELRSQGLEQVPDLLIDISVGDKSGVAKRMWSWRETMKNSEQRRNLWNSFLRTQLQMAMQDPARRDEVFAVVDRQRAAMREERAQIIAQSQPREE